jgi:predicted transcriptional regulator YdeE
MEDVTRDVRDAIEASDPAPIDKYVRSLGLQSAYDAENNDFQFYTATKNADNKTIPKDITTIPANDTEAIIRFLIRENKDFIDKSSIDEFAPLQPDLTKAEQSRVVKDFNKISEVWNSEDKKWADKKKAVQDLVSRYNIDGVEYASFTTDDYVTIDGEKVSDPKKIEEKLMQKVSGKATSEPKFN